MYGLIINHVIRVQDMPSLSQTNHKTVVPFRILLKVLVIKILIYFSKLSSNKVLIKFSDSRNIQFLKKK